MPTMLLLRSPASSRAAQALRRPLGCLALAALPAWCAAASAGPGADADTLRQWLEPQVAAAAAREGWSRYEITVTPPAEMPSAPLAACTRFEPFLAPGAAGPGGVRGAGRLPLGLRCIEGGRGVLMVPAQVQAWAPVPVAAEPLALGTVLESRHWQMQEVELTREPAGADRRPESLLGRTLMRALAPGQPLRADMARPTWVLQPGDPVRMRIQGGGFEASAPAQALQGAAAGQSVRVRTEAGRVLSGVAREGRVVDVSL